MTVLALTERMSERQADTLRVCGSGGLKLTSAHRRSWEAPLDRLAGAGIAIEQGQLAAGQIRFPAPQDGRGPDLVEANHGRNVGRHGLSSEERRRGPAACRGGGRRTYPYHAEGGSGQSKMDAGGRIWGGAAISPVGMDGNHRIRLMMQTLRLCRLKRVALAIPYSHPYPDKGTSQARQS